MISTLAAAGLLLGMGFGAGLWLLTSLFTGRSGPSTSRSTEARPDNWRLHRLASHAIIPVDPVVRRRLVIRVGITAAAGTVTLAATGWPVGAVLATAAAWSLPPMLGPDRTATRQLERCEAIATWTESLRDLVTAGAGLHHAITVSARKAPAPIATEITDLAGAIHRGDRLPPALRRCGQQLSDRTADLVLAALICAVTGHAGSGLANELTALANTARDQVAMRHRLAPTRARIRTSVRIITGTSLCTTAVLAATSHQFLAPYNSFTGQLVLLLVGAIAATAFALLTRLSQHNEPIRFLTGIDRLDPATTRLPAAPVASAPVTYRSTSPGEPSREVST